MDSQDAQVLAAALRWAAAGHRLALVTVARTWGSAPRPPGAWMVLRDDGLVVGGAAEFAAAVDDAEAIEARERDLQARLLAGVSLFDVLNYEDHLTAVREGRPTGLAFG